MQSLPVLSITTYVWVVSTEFEQCLMSELVPIFFGLADLL